MENTKKLSLEEVADRDAIRDIIDAYAYCADSRDAEGQMALFTEDIRCQNKKCGLLQELHEAWDSR